MLTDDDTWSMTDLERIATTQRAVAQLEDALAVAISDARRGGTTWGEIAASLGVARQSAWRRFKEARAPRRKRRCSFCGIEQAKATYMVVAPTGAAICGECLTVANESVAAERG